MNRDGFALGFLATCGQVLLLRGLMASFGGTELLIGAALFGWLVFVALGAWWGGRGAQPISTGKLFISGVAVLPISLAVIKLAPLVVTDVVGEAIPLSTAFGLSILMVAPVAVISGWLFPVIARRGVDPDDSVTNVYLFEGLGAFVGGLVIVLAIGGLLSNFGTGLVTSAIVMFGLSLPVKSFRLSTAFVGLLLLVAAVLTGGGNSVDQGLESIRHPDYEVAGVFDSHYGQQSVLWREGDLVLLTDNGVEASHPDLESAENMLVPPLIYRPDAREILFIGRSEFGVRQLAAEFPDVHLTTVDPRRTLSEVLDRHLAETSGHRPIVDDPVAYLSESAMAGRFDIIILNPGAFDSFRNSRFVTAEFLNLVQTCLKPDGLFFLPTNYDTDRYITGEIRELLSIVYRTLSGTFSQVNVWPGSMTLFMASDALPIDLSYDTVAARLSRLPYRADYISEDYLLDRLSELKSERLREAITPGETSNRLTRPLLTTVQAWYRSKANAVDRGILRWVIRKPVWLILVPVVILVFFRRAVSGPKRRDRYALYLYFVAGMASLSLELVAFYTYQSVLGTLYYEIALLIGTFMLGLALGAYAAARATRFRMDRLALLTLLATTILYDLTWDTIPDGPVRVYHLLFLFVVATATGSLFVAATRLYYGTNTDRNRGLGYAWELTGSALGALLTTTVLLPVIGLDWLLISIAVLLITAIIGGVMNAGSVVGGTGLHRA